MLLAKKLFRFVAFGGNRIQFQKWIYISSVYQSLIVLAGSGEIKRNKHIAVTYNFVRDIVSPSEVQVEQN